MKKPLIEILRCNRSLHPAKTAKWQIELYDLLNGETRNGNDYGANTKKRLLQKYSDCLC